MAIEGMKVIDLDSHLVGDLESWGQTVEDNYREFLPRKLPTKDNERRKTLVGNQIMIGSELGRQVLRGILGSVLGGKRGGTRR